MTISTTLLIRSRCKEYRQEDRNQEKENGKEKTEEDQKQKSG